MTAIAIAPRMYSNIMTLPSQAGAGSKIKCRDGKGRRANRDIDHVEQEVGHLVILFGASPATHKSTFANMQSGRRPLALIGRIFLLSRLPLRLKLLQASNVALHIAKRI